MGAVILLVAFVGLVSPASAATGDRPERREREKQLGQASTADESSRRSASPSWDLQAFARGGLAGLASNGHVVWSGPVPPQQSRVPESLAFEHDVSRQRRSPAWGAGLRAMRGRWGLEAQYTRVSSGAFQPGSMIQETLMSPLRDLAPGREAEDLFMTQAILEFPIRGGSAHAFAGLGAGGVRLPTPDRTRRDGVLITDFYNAEVEPRYAPSLSQRFAPAEQSGRWSFLVGGSAGLTLQRGRVLIRPRVDMFLRWARRTEVSWEVEGEFDQPDGLQWIALGSESVEVVARPVYVLFGVDIGWSSRP